MTILSRKALPAEASDTETDRLAAALRSCRGALAAVAAFSGCLNILMLAGTLYMLQVYDRVLASRSIATLVALTLLLAVVYAVQGILDIVRQRLMTRIGGALDRQLADEVYRLTIATPTRRGATADALQPGRDLDSVRAFMSGLGPTALFDIPWLPVFLVLCFALHVWIGFLALAGALLLLAIAVLTERATRKPMAAGAREAARRAALAETSRRNADAIAAMGMQDALGARYGAINERFLDAGEAATDAAGQYGTLSRVLRMGLQSAALGLGALLVITGEATPGVMIAGSILLGRALAPIETAVAHWRSFVAARQAWRRLRDGLRQAAPAAPALPLPRAKRLVTLDQVFAGAPGSQTLILHGISLSLMAGQGLGVIGPSAAGKSTLGRILSGAWRQQKGSVRLDGAEFDQWSDEARGRFIGYVPQDVALFDGTVADNIARFRPDAEPTAVIAAAEIAGADAMIRALPAGYATRIGDGGMLLSGGQRQRIALARALFGDPFLVVLDEPNANLDAEGEAAVTQAIRHVRARGGIAVVIAHRPSAIAAVDLVAVMGEGRIQAFGPKDDIVKRVSRPQKGVAR